MAKESNAAMELRDLVPAEPLLPDPRLPVWVWFLLAIVTIVLVAGLILFLRRKKKLAAADPRAAIEAAYRQATAELAEAPGGSIQVVATHISVTLRRYLAAACSDPALFETHEEFISRHAALSGYPEELRNETAAGFSHLAKLKYGKDASGDSDALMSGARKLLDRLHTHQPA